MGDKMSKGTAINPDDCLHCFCSEDTAGNLKCCKCGSILIVNEIGGEYGGAGDIEPSLP